MNHAHFRIRRWTNRPLTLLAMNIRRHLAAILDRKCFSRMYTTLLFKKTMLRLEKYCFVLDFFSFWATTNHNVNNEIFNRKVRSTFIKVVMARLSICIRLISKYLYAHMALLSCVRKKLRVEYWNPKTYQ